MSDIDYTKLNEIKVRTQKELDSIPLDFKGLIYIDCGDSWIRVSKRYYNPVVARGNSSVVASNNSSVVARGNSSVVAWGNSLVVANSNVQVVDFLQGAKIQISGNARIVYNPKTIHEFMDFYDIKHDKKKAVFYKAAHYDENKESYYSDYDSSFVYVIGEVVKAECDPDVEEDCSNGIHVSTQNWALDFGKDWDDLAILELETDIDKIVLPKNSDGKVRTSEAKILREVPLEECGLYGKILAKRKVNE